VDIELIFEEGTRAMSVNITTLDDDIAEGPEQFTLDLMADDSLAIVHTDSVQITVEDNDGKIILTVIKIITYIM